MCRILLFFCLFFISCFAVSSGLAANAPAEEKDFRIESIQADFTQEKHLKILAKPIISTGKLLFQAPGSLRWEYTSPFASILLMHEGKVKRFIKRDGIFQEETGMQLDAMQVVLTEISSWLDGRFTDNELFSVSFPDDKTVELTPKDEAFGKLIERIDLKLSEQKGLLDQVTITEGPGASTIMRFSNRVLNQAIPARSFTQR
ncbi:MAG: outer membrane lipoprotein carrier protein LolA [Candidatus Electrothrix aestuarii]|uniref:Outer membrane lipoprotein carrier protein LolA n=1 Tax=Candidatus Electrothrix aestuarii TaxID=3062594 RepID=A0AAU8M179_9BACT|nr:outer membrane lipoprotein carrier protein LolA [Candidatus Electrothrix aestuarii]